MHTHTRLRAALSFAALTMALAFGVAACDDGPAGTSNDSGYIGTGNAGPDLQCGGVIGGGGGKSDTTSICPTGTNGTNGAP